MFKYSCIFGLLLWSYCLFMNSFKWIIVLVDAVFVFSFIHHSREEEINAFSYNDNCTVLRIVHMCYRTPTISCPFSSTCTRSPYCWHAYFLHTIDIHILPTACCTSITVFQIVWLLESDRTVSNCEVRVVETTSVYLQACVIKLNCNVRMNSNAYTHTWHRVWRSYSTGTCLHTVDNRQWKTLLV